MRHPGSVRASGALLYAALLTQGTARATEPADLVLFDGKVLTVDGKFSIQSAVAVKDGKIVAVGGREVARHYTALQRIDLQGRVLMPGFIDTHLHLTGLSHRDIEPAKAKSIAAIQAMVAAKAKELGPGEWIGGYGWDEALLEEKRNLTMVDLDKAAPENPVVLVRAGSHSAVGNSLAFARAGITSATPNPEGGLIERDPAGHPSGIIRERTQLLLRLVPPDTFEQLRPGYVKNLEGLLSLGITSFMEAWTSLDDEPVGKGGIAGTAAEHTWRQLQSIYAQLGPQLPRLTAYIAYPGAERLKAFPYHTGYGDDRIKLGPIGETPYDGGFTGPTAFTKEDYKGLPGFRGKALMTEEQAKEMVATSAALGWQLGIHAIGDAAIETMAGVYDKELAAHPKTDHRWFLAHFTMIPSVATMQMIARDQVYAAAQPNFLYNLEGRYESTLDGYRLEHINPLATALHYGVKLAFGSDNLPIGPMVGLYAAITRRGPDGHVLGAEEAVTREEAVRLYTREAAYLAWDEDKKGSLEVGKLADMIVLDHDLLTEPAEQILSTRVDITLVGGKVVYERKSGT